MHIFTVNTQQAKKFLITFLMLCCILSGCGYQNDLSVTINKSNVSIDYIDAIVKIDLNVEKDYKIEKLNDGYCIKFKESLYKQPIEIYLGMQTNELLNITIKEKIDLFYYEYFIEYDLNTNSYTSKLDGNENIMLTYNENSLEAKDGNIITLDGYIEILPYSNREVAWEKIGFSNSENGYKKRDIYYLINISKKA